MAQIVQPPGIGRLPAASHARGIVALPGARGAAEDLDLTPQRPSVRARMSAQVFRHCNKAAAHRAGIVQSNVTTVSRKVASFSRERER